MIPIGFNLHRISGLKGKNEDRRQKFCKKEEVKSKCLIECGECCADNQDYTFYVDNVVTLSSKKAGKCGWLSFLTDDLKNQVCKKWDGFGKVVRDGCPKSCDWCMTSTLAPVTPTSSSPTPAEATTLPTHSAMPTHSAAPTATFNCEDDASFQINGNKNDDCRYVRYKEERRLELCKYEVVNNSCPTACGSCCNDSEDYTFKMGSSERNCKWVAGRGALQRATLCDSFKGKIMVRHGCPKACGFCKLPVPGSGTIPGSLVWE